MPSSDPLSDQPPNPSESKPTSSTTLRNSSGWDGKLRHPSKELGAESSERKATLTNPEALEDPDYSDPDAPPPDLLPADEDLLDDYPEDSEDIDLVHCRIGSIPSLRLERFQNVERLCLRQNAISDIKFPDGFGQKLQELDLYDNLIKHVDGLEGFAGSIDSLDLSFNKIKHIRGVGSLKALRDLYFVQNRIQKIEGLEGLAKLKMLELAANRIRVGFWSSSGNWNHAHLTLRGQDLENLETLTSLEELWLGKNKITEIKVCAPRPILTISAPDTS
jgi:protein phosphatase 1 regulatory subunit 7